MVSKNGVFAGHFFPDEDDKFLERVRVAVEEEERQAAAAAETRAAKDAIASAEESRKATVSRESHVAVHDDHRINSPSTSEDHKPVIKDDGNSARTSLDSERRDSYRPGPEYGYDSVASLPFEFYHYYHGSNNDLGTLIEASLLNPSLASFLLLLLLCHLPLIFHVGNIWVSSMQMSF